MTEQQNVRVGLAVIVEHNGKVLLCLRKGKHAGGHWGFPGGHLELGESPEDCAAREAMEEAAITLGNLRRGPYTSDIFEESGKHYITLFMRADLPPGQVPRVMEPDKCDRWEWFSPDALPQPLMVGIVNLLKDGHVLTEENQGLKAA